MYNKDKKKHTKPNRKEVKNMKREKALVLENWSDIVGIHPTTHSATDKLAGITSLSTNCKSCDSCIKLHKHGLEQKKRYDELKKLIKNQENRIKNQLKKPENKRNYNIINDATEKRKELVHEINQIDVLVCAFCFADSLLDYKKNIQIGLDKNTEILTSRILEDSEIPFINRMMFRFESFGDLHNTTQAINYINIASKNPHCNFAWWSKRPYIIQAAMDKLGIDKLPENIIPVYSSYYMNRIDTEIHKKYSFIKIVFTVFDKYYLEEHTEITINCGSRQCMACLNCYKKRLEENEIFYVNELVK